MFDVIIIGAGAAGLMAAKELSTANKKVLILEALHRLGGRINTIHDPEFSFRIEAGAEFIHGKLKTTLQLLKEAKIEYELVGGESWQLHEGKIKRSDYFEYWDELLQQLKKLETDVPIAHFLEKYFGDDKYSVLRKTVINFVEGYDAADTTKASSKALYNEWKNEDDEHQYRIKDGYIKLIDHLKDACTNNGVVIETNKPVKHIKWQENNCIITTSNKEKYKSTKILCTVPLAVLQSPDNAEANINFSPAIEDKIKAAKEIGFGGIIKIIIQFKNPFWEEIITSNQIPDLGFVFSEAFIPTWWSQKPYNNNTLTGWLGGPKAEALKDVSDTEFFNKAIESLQTIFNCNKQYILNEIEAWKVFNWFKQPFTQGAYSYAMLQSEEAKKALRMPVKNTLFFAGEALYDGAQSGTVEGALVSGRETAKKILSSF